MAQYHLGTSDLELERLAFQHQVWADVSIKLWDEAAIGPGMHVLDLGCGPGFASLDLARRVTHSGSVQSVDASERFLEYLDKQAHTAGLQHISTRQSDVHGLDIEDEQFDVVFIRWLLCFVHDPARVLAECKRVLKPGGQLIAWDYYNYDAVGLFPGSTATDRLFDAYRKSALLNEGSYDIGNRLPAMLLEIGMQLSYMDTVNRVALPGSPTWQWASLFHDSYVPKLVEQGLLSKEEAAAFINDWNSAEKRPGSYFAPPPMLTLIACK